MAIGDGETFNEAPNSPLGGTPFVAAEGRNPEPQVLQQRYKFTPDELRVLKECNRESFYFRCLPIGTAFGVGAYYAVRMGYLKPSVKWGAGPKMFIGSIVGYFIGKFSYQSKCAEKLMQLPNSPLADILRKQKGRMGFQETMAMEPGFVSAAPMIQGPATFSSEYKQAQQGNSLTDVGDTRPMNSFDSEAPTFSGIDDSYGGSYDTTEQMLNDDNLPQKRPQFVTTYDELRKQNRSEFEHGSKSSASTTYEPPTKRSYTPPPPQRESSNKIKNAYGDVWDEKPQ